MIGRDVKNKNYDKINLIEKTWRKNNEYNITYHGAGIGSRFGTGIKQLEPVMMLTISSWTTQSMMQLRQVSIMWYLSSARISRKSSKRSSVIVLPLFALSQCNC